MKTQMDAVELCSKSFDVLMAMRTKLEKLPFETKVHELYPSKNYNEVLHFLEAFETEYQKEIGMRVPPADTLQAPIDFSSRSIVSSDGTGDDGP